MLNIQDLSFSYPQKPVLTDFSMTLARGEILAVMGPSGCGKSTLLNLIAGLSKPNSGKLICNAKRISYLFQEPRLFPWLTVEQNLRAVIPKGELLCKEELQTLLASVGLSDAAALYPDELSGGMRSRVAIARALAYGGDLFLLDEPFAALDDTLRTELIQVVLQKLRDLNASAILVTHQLEDAERMADRILQWNT